MDASAGLGPGLDCLRPREQPLVQWSEVASIALGHFEWDVSYGPYLIQIFSGLSGLGAGSPWVLAVS